MRPLIPPTRKHVGGDGTTLYTGMKVGSYASLRRGRVTSLGIFGRGYDWCGVVFEEGDDTTTEYTTQCSGLFALQPDQMLR